MPAPPCCGMTSRAILRAKWCGNNRPPSGDRRATLLIWIAGALAITTVGFPAAARAQVAGSLNLETDYRLRGYSLSAGRPTATAQISYDHRSGLYINAAATGVARRDEAALLGHQVNVGYARQLSPTLSLDAGLLRSDYRPRYRGRPATHYSEAYVGLTVRRITARLSYSPHYFYKDVATLYGEVGAAVQPSANWRLNAHVGTLIYLRTPAYYYSKPPTKYDWRLGASRQFGQFEAHAALSGGGPGKEYYGGKLRNRTALTAGASWNF